MTIYMLEYDLYYSNFLSDIIKNILKKKGQSTNIITTSRIVDLVKLSKSSQSDFNLYFLDTKSTSDNTDSFKLAKVIRTIEPNALIILISTCRDLCLPSFDYMISALTYIIKIEPKNNLNKKIDTCLDIYLEKQRINTSDIFSYEDKFIKIKLHIDDLYYLTTTSPHKVLIRTKNKKININSSLKTFENVHNKIMRCHKSFLVNINTIQMIDKSNSLLLIENNEEIPISRRAKKNILNFWGN